MAQAQRTDGKGRLTLGANYANRLVMVQEAEGELRLIFGKFVADREMWLYENPTAKAAVAAGLEQAAAGEFSDSPPDLEADADL